LLDPTITRLSRGSIASAGSFCRPRELEHSSSVASV
jgi:2-keto-4-pentenoate hydratase